MIELAAFVHFEGNMVSLMPYQSVLKSAAEDGMQDEVFPAGWQEATEWVAAEVINQKTHDKYRVTLYVVRDFEHQDYLLDTFEPVFAVLAKEVITSYILNDKVEFFNPDPHK